ncbi:MAG TPA: alpha/beta fold hydrolase [Candidatus Binatia bacterium]|nr:alpha/beta fold hydrolase [Candidatus Binatia bacterium]
MPVPSRTRFGAAAAALLLVLAVSALAGKPAPLAVQESGSGAPAIVLVHSIGGDRNDWSAVAPLLAAHHRVLVVELPGHGQSPPPEGTPTVEGAATSLAKTLADRKVEHAILVGHSYGALVALKTAADQPKRARAVVAVDAATYTPADSERIAEADRVLTERYTVFLSAVYQAMTKNPETGDSLLARAMRVQPSLLTGYFHDSWREDLRPAIRTMKTPVHLVATVGLWPDAESWTSARKRLGYETAGPAVGHRVAESAHMVALDQPDSLAAIIETVAAHP